MGRLADLYAIKCAGKRAAATPKGLLPKNALSVVGNLLIADNGSRLSGRPKTAPRKEHCLPKKPQ